MNISVVGIGNILLSDEGIGVRVVEELQKLKCLPVDVKVVDGGTIGMDLVSVLKGCQRLVVVDAVSGGQKPGSIYLFTSKQLRLYFQTKLSMHEMGLQEVLQVLAMLGKPIQEVVIVGVEPALIEMGLELSPIVQGQLCHVVETVCNQLAAWGVQVNLCAEGKSIGNC